jgi:hypothetical protein
MKPYIVFAIAALVAATTGVTALQKWPRAVPMKEANSIRGGDVFSSCSFPTCQQYGSCAYSSVTGEYYADPVSTTKSCSAALYFYCSNSPGTVTCIYNSYSDSKCTVLTGTSSTTGPWCATLNPDPGGGS